jgi:peptidoglycan hydrolase CwlO-like protein
MLKKALVVVLGLVLLVGLLFGRSAWSYVTATVSELRDSVKSNVPVEFELKRAKKEISKIDEDVREAMHEIAKEEVQVEKLAKQIDKKEQVLAKAKSDIMTLTAHLESGEKYYVAKGSSYSRSKVEADLSRRFERFKTEEETLGKLRMIYEARERGLNAAHDKLEAMRSAQKQLEVEVANLEAEQKMIEVAKASSEFDFDDSRLSSVRNSLDEIRTRLEVDRKLADADVYYPDEIPVGEEAAGSGSILEEINAHFNPEDDSYVDSAR